MTTKVTHRQVNRTRAAGRRITSRKNLHIILTNRMYSEVTTHWNLHQRLLNGPLETSWTGAKLSANSRVEYLVTCVSSALAAHHPGWSCWTETPQEPDAPRHLVVKADSIDRLKIAIMPRYLKLGVEKVLFNRRFAGAEVLELICRLVASACYLR